MQTLFLESWLHNNPGISYFLSLFLFFFYYYYFFITRTSQLKRWITNPPPETERPLWQHVVRPEARKAWVPSHLSPGHPRRLLASSVSTALVVSGHLQDRSAPVFAVGSGCWLPASACRSRAMSWQRRRKAATRGPDLRGQKPPEPCGHVGPWSQVRGRRAPRFHSEGR